MLRTPTLMETVLMTHLRSAHRSWLYLAAFSAAALLAGCDNAPAAGKAAPTATAAPAAPAAPVAPAPAATTAAAAEKVYDCGAKGQKPCPLQGWMKKVMAGASSNEDGPALAKALTYVADHAPPEYKGWQTIAGDGAVKAKAGDIDGAKASCKQCHDAFKAKYKAEMRDRPF